MSGEPKPMGSDEDRASLIRAEVRNILASEAFRNSKRAGDFVELVVEHALAGRLESLRERMLGVEMFGRPVDYDTANDAVVRVKATEVRRRLAQYYGELKATPVVRIELPPGSYVPRFNFEVPGAAADSAVMEPAGGSPTPSADRARSGLSKLRVALWIGIGALAAILVVTGLVLSRRPAGGRGIHSIAVLPLVNYSGDQAQEYFADGMTESLITELGQIASLRVISRTSSMTYKGTHKTIPQIARELSVDAVVEGSVEHEGNRVRITTQLIAANGDQHLWAHSYDRDMTDTLALQSEVARAIAQQIRAELTPMEEAHLSRTRRVDPEAIDLYMRGMQQFNGVVPQDAIDYFQKAVNKDPEFAGAHAALAKAYGWAGEAGHMPYAEAFGRQREEALKAVELDDSLPEPHLELALAALDQSWDFATAKNELQRALAAGPNSTRVHRGYAVYLIRIGHAQEAVAEANTALELDPLSSLAYVDLAFIHYFARQYDAALDDLQHAAQLPHTSQEFNFPLGDIDTEKGRYLEAAQKFKELGGPHALGHLGNIYARQGRVAEATAIIEQMKQEVQRSGIGRYEIALIYAGRGDKDRAFEWLQTALKTRDKGMLYLRIDPCVDPLRSDGRFQQLISAVGFPQ
jgi:TolB-like protein/tetratricopeptide (TPR) repeat protein